MPAENIPELQDRMNAYIEEKQIDLSKGPVLVIDEIVSPKDVTVEQIATLKLLAPFGTDNPVPNFLFKQVAVENVKRIGSNQQHLKLSLVDEDSQLDAVAFGFGPQENEFVDDSLDIVGQLSINEWNGRKKPQ